MIRRKSERYVVERKAGRASSNGMSDIAEDFGARRKWKRPRVRPKKEAIINLAHWIPRFAVSEDIATLEIGPPRKKIGAKQMRGNFKVESAVPGE
ncbi:hypothetical protein KM043_000780 [Ampulex compressa]|nr:hypothetical protein KM043_000780 [Ampulex compressa]